MKDKTFQEILELISKAIGKIFRLIGHSLYFTLTVLIVVADCGDGAAIPAVVVVVIIIGGLILFLVVVIVFAVVAYSCNACIFIFFCNCKLPLLAYDTASRLSSRLLIANCIYHQTSLVQKLRWGPNAFLWGKFKVCRLKYASTVGSRCFYSYRPTLHSNITSLIHPFHRFCLILKMFKEKACFLFISPSLFLLSFYYFIIFLSLIFIVFFSCHKS